MGFMRRYLRQGDAFIDGGANIGVYALLAASLVTSHGRVDAFEPAPKALARLRENVAINALTQVFVHPVALGASAGLVSFLRDCDTTNRIRTDADVEAVVVDVPCARLDEVVGGRRYAMGKLDLEGAELLALQGAERMLASANPPVWLLELNGSLHAYGLREAQFADWLRCRGYDLALYDADHGELRFEPEPWSEMANVLAVARAVRNEVLEKLSARA
jgi:FkbM family methyltransferase